MNNMLGWGAKAIAKWQFVDAEGHPSSTGSVFGLMAAGSATSNT